MCNLADSFRIKMKNALKFGEILLPQNAMHSRRSTKPRSFFNIHFLSLYFYLFHLLITFRSNENVYLFQFTATEISKICSRFFFESESEREGKELSQPYHLMLVSIPLCMIEMCIIFALFTKKRRKATGKQGSANNERYQIKAEQIVAKRYHWRWHNMA